jgi:hypothetical protein
MNQKVILSLSTIPPRFGMLGKSLNSLINQKRRADEIHIYIPKTYRRFPEHSFCVPDVPEGVYIKIIDHDYGPATKALPCAKAYRGTNTRIIYGDDDRFADTSWLDNMLKCTDERPEDVIVSSGMTLENYGLTINNQLFFPRAKRAKVKYDFDYLLRRLGQSFLEIITNKSRTKPARCNYSSSGYVDIALGVGGVSVSPDFFDDICFEIPEILWPEDDVWLSGNYLRQGIGIWAGNKIRFPVDSGASNTSALAHSIINGKGRNKTAFDGILHMQESYDIW